MDLEELTIVDDGTDDIIHIVALVGLIRDDGVEYIIDTIDGIRGLDTRGILHIVLGDEGEEVTDEADTSSSLSTAK